MAAGMVWLKLRSEANDDGALMFPLPDHKHLPLNPIAAHWKLDPSTLRVGHLALIPDANGSSVSSIDDIRGCASSAGFGDGLTQQSPLVISGNPASDEEDDLLITPKWKSLAETVAAAAVEAEEYKKYNNMERQVLYPIRRLLQSERLDAMMEELCYSKSGVHHYTNQVLSHESMEKEVATFVGSVYVNGRATGMVTLVHPQGLCVTASDCLKGFRENSSKLQVKFPRLTGESLYDCRIKKRHSLVVHLETLKVESFKQCIAVGLGAPGSYIFDGGESMKLVKCLEVETLFDPMEILILPVCGVKGRSVIGGPVVNDCGELKGVVVSGSTFLKKADSRSAKRCKTRGGAERKVQSVLDLEQRRKHAEKEKSFGPISFQNFQDWTNALHQRRVIEYMPACLTPSSDAYLAQNPLTRYIDQVVATVSKPGFKFETRKKRSRF